MAQSAYRQYLEESRTPLAGLAFSLPLFALYHAGVWVIREAEEVPWANGADVVLARALRVLGLGGPLVSLFFVTAVLLFLHQAQRRPWRLHVWVLGLMLVESMVSAIPPFFLGKLLHAFGLAAGGLEEIPAYAGLILSIGAGLYEEFLFRLILLNLLLWFFRGPCRVSATRAHVIAILLQALLFAAFHHLPGFMEPFTLRAFAFRTLAGVYFAYLYCERGFGVAAGAHAIYDVFAVSLMAFR